MKCYDTLTDEILQYMPFKMEFLNGNRMFVDALSRQPSEASENVAAVAPPDTPFTQLAAKATPLLDSAIIIAHHWKLFCITGKFLPLLPSPRLYGTHICSKMFCANI